MSGVVIFLTGLSGSGKSTIADILMSHLTDAFLLDGDAVRQLCPGLGYSKQDRDTNILRVGFAAAEIAAAGKVVVCACIAPYDETRKSVRAMVEKDSVFVLVYLCTALDVCEDRDPKGLYVRARMGFLPHFTGISDPYEEPTDAELVIDTSLVSPAHAAYNILNYAGLNRQIRDPDLHSVRYIESEP